MTGKLEGLESELLQYLERMEKAGIMVDVLSGLRSLEENDRLVVKDWAVNNSAHLTGKACDLRSINGRHRWQIICKAIELGIVRIGVGRSFVHIDIDKTKPQDVMWTYYGKPKPQSGGSANV